MSTSPVVAIGGVEEHTEIGVSIGMSISITSDEKQSVYWIEPPSNE